MKHEEAFKIGYITKTKGLKGEVQIYFTEDDYEDFDLDVVFADMNGKLVPFFVEAIKLYPNSTGLCFFEDIDHIDKAQALVKKNLYLPLSKKPVRDPDDLEYSDLVGYLVTDTRLGELGTIINVYEYPQQFVAEIHYQQREILFPLNDDLIVEIDDDEKTMEVDLPEGLIDIYINPEG